MPINQMRPGGEARGAVHERVIEGLLAYGDEAVRVVGHALVCNVEFLKVAVMDVLDDIGCNYLVHSRVADAVVESDRITGVVVAGKDGLVKINAKAAAMSVKKDCTPRQLDVKELQNALADDGVDYAKRRPQ